jgi:hypothetical protein
VVEDPVESPVEVEVEPGADGEPQAEEQARRTHVDDRRVVHGDVQVLRLGGPDLDAAGGRQHLHLRRRDEVAGRLRLRAEPLDGGHHLDRLVDIRLAKRCRPVQVVRHHLENGRVMGDGLDADVPGLPVDVGGVGVGADETGRVVNLVGERRGNQDLRQQRIRVQGNRGQQVVQLLRREQLVRWHVLCPKQRHQADRKNDERDCKDPSHDGCLPNVHWRADPGQPHRNRCA